MLQCSKLVQNVDYVYLYVWMYLSFLTCQLLHANFTKVVLTTLEPMHLLLL